MFLPASTCPRPNPLWNPAYHLGASVRQEIYGVEYRAAIASISSSRTGKAELLSSTTKHDHVSSACC
jgi:hypothetical protein